MRRSRATLLAFLLCATVATIPLGAGAQDASPVAVEPSPTRIVAAGLTSPRGVIWDADGTMWVALAGSGGNTEPTEESPAGKILGPIHGGPTGAVARIVDGCAVAVATGLPSQVDAGGGVLGPEALALLGGKLYVGVDGGGTTHGNPDQPSGIYEVGADGATTLVADLSAFVRANPAAKQQPDYDPDSDGYWMVADEAAGALWVIEPNIGGVLQVRPDGAVTRIIDWSVEHPVPSAIALSGDGGVYVGMLTPVPYLDGFSVVRKVMPDGTATDVWTGLTMVTGLAVDAEGTLYATEMATGNIKTPPFIAPGTGKVVRQTGPDSSEDVATGLDFPIGLSIAPDGGIYVAGPAVGSLDGSGVVMQVGNVSGDPVTAGDAPSCQPIPETLTEPIPHEHASPEASPSA